MAVCSIIYPGNGVNFHYTNAGADVLKMLEPVILASGYVLMPICDIAVGGTQAVDTDGFYEFEAEASTYAIGSMARYDSTSKKVDQTAANPIIGVIIDKRTVGTKYFVTVHINRGFAIEAAHAAKAAALDA